MNKPLLAALLASALSVGVTTVWFHRQTARMIAHAIAYKAEQAEAARPEKPWDFWTPEMENMAKELAASRAALAQRENAVATAEARLAEERRQLEALRHEIETLRTRVDERLLSVQAEELRNLRTLANTYSRLSPQATVAIFNELDDTLVVKLLSLMKPETTSAILQAIASAPGPDSARRAAELTQRLRFITTPPATPAPGAR